MCASAAAPAGASFLFAFFGCLRLLGFGLDLEEFDISEAAFDLDMLDVAADVVQLSEDRQNNEVDEAALTTCDLGSCPIAQEGDLHAMLSLVVALSEELREEAISPELGDIEASDGCGDVRCV